MTYCKSVLIKFMSRGEPQQEVRATEVISACRLHVYIKGQFLVVDYITQHGHCIKQLNFNLVDVKEYACEDIFTVPRPTDTIQT